MKFLLTAAIVAIATLGMANTTETVSNDSIQVEYHIGKDKGKKARRGKRARKRRKKACNKSARRNFAG